MSINVNKSNRFYALFSTVAKASGLFQEKYAQDDYEESIADITWQTKCRIFNRQANCLHVKGGRRRGLSYKDYALTTHTFIDGRTRIKCMYCGTEAYSRSGWDFKFAWLQNLAEYSTNRPSSSERPLLAVSRGGSVIDSFPDTKGGRAELKAKYPRWDGKVERGRDAAGINVVYADDAYYTAEHQEDSIYNKPENSSEFIQIGEDINPIKGAQPATKFDDGSGVLVIGDGATVLPKQ